jgi:flagella basal body P-ring formation protein FlgA
MRILQLLSLLLIGYGQTTSTAPVVTVKVRETSDVPNRTFTLGEIAEVTGADKSLAFQVTTVEVGTSPLPGLSRRLSHVDVIARLRFNHVDTRKVTIVWPAAARVTRSGTELPVQEVVEVGRKAIEAARKDNNDGTVIEPAQLPAKWMIPPGKRVYEAGPVRGQVESGKVSVEVRVLVDGKPVKTIDLPFTIKRMTMVLMAKRRILAHTVLTEDDLTTGPVELSATTANALTDASVVVGKRTVRQIELGAPLTESLVELPPAVVTGAKVTLEVVVGGVRISTAAVARSSGAVGSRVRVYAAETKKEVTAVVVDSKTVRTEESQ